MEYAVVPGGEMEGNSLQPAEKQVVIFTSGSRGDVQPYVALGLHLQTVGYKVAIATEQRMRPLVIEFGLEHRCLAGDPTGFLFEPGATEALANASMFELVRITKELDKKYPKEDILPTYITCAVGADLIISAGPTLAASYSIAEKMSIPWVPIVLAPAMPTSQFPIWPLEFVAVCSCLNKWTYNLAFKMVWNIESKFINPWRSNTLHLDPINSPRGIIDIIDAKQPPVIIACSEKVIGPHGEIPDDYPVHVHVPGFFFVPPTPDSAIDPSVVQFMADNKGFSRVIYLGFGSMPVGNPLDLVSLTVEVCSTLSCRAILAAGWSELQRPDCQRIVQSAVESGQLLIVPGAPHDWLFPRVNCIIHHCGIGTMAAALKAGKPQIPCPVMLDQPYNARSVQRLGCCLDVIPAAQLGKTRLIQALERVFSNQNDVYGAAERVGVVVTKESQSALDNTCNIIATYLQEFQSHTQL